MLHQFEEDVTEAGPHRPYESPTTVHKLRLPHLQVDVQLRFFFFVEGGGIFVSHHSCHHLKQQGGTIKTNLISKKSVSFQGLSCGLRAGVSPSCPGTKEGVTLRISHLGGWG